MYRERKRRDEKQRARVKVTIIQMESQSQQTRDKRRHWRKCVWIQKKLLQAHLLDRLPLPHLRPHLVETRETWTFLSHHATRRGKQALGSCWNWRNNKYTPRQQTQPREKMHSTVRPLVERILVLGKRSSVSWFPCQRSWRLKGRENSQQQRGRPWPRNHWHLRLSCRRQLTHLNSWPHQSRVERRLPRSSSITGFAAESDQIRKILTFSNLWFLKLCTSHILVFGCLCGQDVVRSKKK